MSDNENFYSKFNTDSPKKHNFKSNIFVPFISGVLGASLVIGLTFGVPNIRKTLIPNTESTNSDEISNSRNS
ncbi:MAG: hypothetical protein IJB90_02995 [Clostridia bacterium]|nr:hypothetical protein [Clostridia bacterium]